MCHAESDSCITFRLGFCKQESSNTKHLGYSWALLHFGFLSTQVPLSCSWDIISGRCDYCTLLHLSTQALQQVAKTTHLGGVTIVLSSIFCNSDPPTSSWYNVSGRCDYCTLLCFATQTRQQVADTTYLGGVTTVLSSVLQLRPSNK